MQLNGSEIIIECLKEQGVDTVFGYPGGTILNVYDELYKHSDEIKHILTSHEQGAAHAADGYARATGRVGVCMATSGPGATNLVTGIATAYMDSVPLVGETGSISCLSYSATAAVTSFVISTNTGPGLPVCAILKARRIVGAKSAIFFTIKLYFVIGIATPAISIS